MAIVKFTGINEVELKKLEAALQEDAVVEALNKAADAEEVKKILEANGMNFTAEEIEKIRETMTKAAEAGEELTDADMEDVAGGGSFTLVSISWKTKKGVSVTVNIPW